MSALTASQRKALREMLKNELDVTLFEKLVFMQRHNR